MTLTLVYAEQIQYDELYIDSCILCFYVLLVILTKEPFLGAKYQVFNFFSDRFFCKRTPEFGFSLYDEAICLDEINSSFDFMYSQSPLDSVSVSESSKLVYKLWRHRILKKGVISGYYPESFQIKSLCMPQTPKKGRTVDKFRSYSTLGSEIQRYPPSKSSLKLLQEIINEHL